MKLLIVAGALLFVSGCVLVVHELANASYTKSMDNVFGDQHLKTSLALIELYKIRTGKYPAQLSDLTFTGQWDQIAIQNVRYYPNADRTAYYLEVKRGWIGKPELEMPPEFWRGTGYDPKLKPATR
jgi:hypothetical protein